MVFSQLSAVLVPALCDDVSIDLVEDGGHRYRIRRPSSAIGSSIGTSIPTANGLVSGRHTVLASRPGTRASERQGEPGIGQQRADVGQELRSLLAVHHAMVEGQRQLADLAHRE